MKNRFTKTIPALLMTSVIFMFSGFCMLQLSSSNFIGVNVAQAATFDSVIDTTSSNPSSCGEEQPAKNSLDQTATTPANHNQSSPMVCCVDGSHRGVVSIIQSSESGVSIPVAFFPQNQFEIFSPQIAYTYSPDTSPPNPDLIKTTVLRL